MGDVRDISLEGLCLLTDDPLGRGAQQRLLLTDGLSYVSMELQAQVVWSARGRRASGGSASPKQGRPGSGSDLLSAD